jgi:CheY-like chemotaxis protein
MNPAFKFTVLVVDDNPLVRVHSHLALEDAGFEVIEASDAADALARLEERPDIAAVFTDIHMPGALDGIGLARVVHARRPDISILVTSGTAPAARCELPGEAQFIQKPYTGAQLSKVLYGQLEWPARSDDRSKGYCRDAIAM